MYGNTHSNTHSSKTLKEQEQAETAVDVTRHDNTTVSNSMIEGIRDAAKSPASYEVPPTRLFDIRPHTVLLSSHEASALLMFVGNPRTQLTGFESTQRPTFPMFSV